MIPERRTRWGKGGLPEGQRKGTGIKMVMVSLVKFAFSSKE